MYRFFETLPAFLAWSTLGGVIFFSWAAPAEVSFFIIAFDIYWLLKTLYLSLHLRTSFKKMRENLKINWREKLNKLEIPAKEVRGSLNKIERQNLEQNRRIPNSASHTPRWRDIYHLVILPLYKEPYEVVRETFVSLAAMNYPKDTLIVILATEARAPEGYHIAQKIDREFGGQFFKFLITSHPADLPNEIPGKGSNETWAARETKRLIIDPAGIPYERIMASVFDIDSHVSPEYFGILTHTFLTTAHPQRSSYQPIPLFTNNIFQTPALARVIAFSSSFWHMIQQSRPERLTTFSSHAMPFQALIEIGFWQTDIVSEDSRIFWQCFLHYNGDWRTVPIFYPISMDASGAPTFWQTMKNVYKQQRRWGWGCENIPYLLDGFRRNQRISRTKKIYWAFHYIEGFHSWATNALIIFSLGWLPLIIGGSEFNTSLLSYNLPRITRAIMNVAMLGIVSSAILSMIVLPPKPAWFRRRHYVFYVAQWLLMPLTLIIFGALPGLDAQTRLALSGTWRLGFWHTPKYR